MKRLILMAIVTVGVISVGMAQKVQNYGFFNHASIGLSAGTTGIGLEISFPVTKVIQFTAGYSFMPKISVLKNVDYYYYIHSNGMNIRHTETTEVEGQLHMGDGKFLVEVSPFENYSFHVTAGLYVGKTVLITAQNNEPLSGINPDGEIMISGHKIKIGTDGIARATVEVNKVKPYIGIGFGRSVPKKRVSVSFDAGLIFWGSPAVYEDISGEHIQASSVEMGYEDKGLIDDIGTIKIMPVINLKLAVRLF